MSNIENKNYSQFEQGKKTNESGVEYWFARELQELLQYKEWRNFSKVIDTAKIACKVSQQELAYHFVEVNKMVDAGISKKSIKDYKLTRYACYLIVMNGDPRKEVIALGQTYFAVKTRQQEIAELYDILSEEDKRLFLRGDIKQKNMLLFEAARQAGVKTNYDYATFNDAGYKGLYGGLITSDIASLKNLAEGEEILDYMGSEELAANLFRITQTEAKLKRDNINTKEKASEAHYNIGAGVRKTIKEFGGTMPEELPIPEKSIGALKKEKIKEIKEKK